MQLHRLTKSPRSKLFLTIILLFLISSCGGSGQTPEPESGETIINVIFVDTNGNPISSSTVPGPETPSPTPDPSIVPTPAPLSVTWDIKEKCSLKKVEITIIVSGGVSPYNIYPAEQYKFSIKEPQKIKVTSADGQELEALLDPSEYCQDDPPQKEICGNRIDDDNDGQVDEGCDNPLPTDPPPTEPPPPPTEPPPPPTEPPSNSCPVGRIDCLGDGTCCKNNINACGSCQ